MGFSLPPKTTQVRDEPVLGYRAWKVAGHGGSVPASLCSWAKYPYFWEPCTDLTATCLLNFTTSRLTSSAEGVLHGSGHPSIPAPIAECHCGLYGFTSIDKIPMGGLEGPWAIGAIWAWGKVLQHGDVGFRAQRARVLALLDLEPSRHRSDDYFRSFWPKLAERYRVPLLKPSAMEVFVKEFASALP